MFKKFLRSFLACASLIGLLAIPVAAEAQTLLSQGRPVVASSTQAPFVAANAVDGNAVTRWGSNFTNNEWIYVDLGTTATISRVLLSWEAAYGTGYQIQVSANASTWTTIFTTTTGNGATDDLAVNGSGRYVRMLGTARATQWGYSLFEFQVFGTSGSNSCTTLPGAPASLNASGLSSTSATINWSAANPGANCTITNYLVFRNGVQVASSAGTSAPVNALTANTNYSFTVAAVNGFGTGPHSGALSVTTPASSTATLLSQGRPVVASSAEGAFVATNAVDGNVGTRWGSAFTNNEWIYVDLGATATISRVLLNWEAAYGTGYQIQVSANASNWTTIFTTTTGNGATDDLTVNGSGRYVRMLGTARATQWGYSLFEFQVFGTGGSNNNNCAALPGAPTGLGASGLSSTNVTINWTAANPGANCTITNYLVFRNGAQVASSAGTSALINGLTANTTYSFSVAAVNGLGTGPQSGGLSVTTPTGTNPTDPVVSYPGYTGSYRNFTLSVDERFDGAALSAARWSTGDGTFPENNCRFQPQGVRVAGGNMELVVRNQHVPASFSVDQNQIKDARDFSCGEARLRQRIQYGRIEGRFRTPTAGATGFVTSLFTYDVADFQWRELDVELEGGRPGSMSSNYIYGDDANLWFFEWQATRTWGAWERLHPTPRPTRDWIVYAMEWTPDYVAWFMDGVEVRRLVENDVDGNPFIPPQIRPATLPRKPTTVMMNFWIPTPAVMLGFGGNTAGNIYPMVAQYDWFRFYTWTPGTPP